MQKDFKDKSVIVTGGSSGIGREIAYQLCAQGAKLTLAARDPLLLDAVVTECQRRGCSAIGVPTDVSIEDQCKTPIDRAVEQYGRIDTLILSAGISMRARFDDLGGVEPIERLIRINYLGSVYCTYYALPHLKKSRGGIVAVASLAGKAGVPTLTGYSASKHALAGFFDSLRGEISRDAVAITIVYPGFVSTDIGSRSIGPGGSTLGVRVVDRSKAMPADVCAREIIDAAAHRRREVVMTAKGKIGQWVKLVSPGTIDKITARAIERGW
jgi:short-subunit dehydrogenase